jgi:hypothetical protein
VHAGAGIEYVLIAALALGAFLFARRFGGGTALDQLERTNRVLEGTVKRQDEELGALRRRVSELEGKTDLTIALVPVLEALKLHELRAAERSSATLGVLAQIAGRLGPEPA